MPEPVRRRSGLAWLAAASTLATLLLIAVGGLVRATDSGLACPDWPFCYGKVIPLQADIPPQTGYTLWNVWFEHSHRLAASVVGLLILAVAVGALRRYRHRGDVLWPALAAFVLVMLQAYLGRQVVLGLLDADLVTAHLGMALAVVGCLLYLSVNLLLPRVPATAARVDVGLARLSAAVAGLAYLQALVGSAVTGHGAGLVFTDFPLMAGALVPPLGSVAAALHAGHRYLALLLVAAVALLCSRAVARRRALQASGGFQPRQRWLVALPVVAATLVVVQVLLGAANLFFELSPLTVVPHLALASWIWAVLVTSTVLAYRLPAPSQPSAEQAEAAAAEPVAAP